MGAAAAGKIGSVADNEADWVEAAAGWSSCENNRVRSFMQEITATFKHTCEINSQVREHAEIQCHLCTMDLRMKIAPWGHEWRIKATAAAVALQGRREGDHSLINRLPQVRASLLSQAAHQHIANYQTSSLECWDLRRL